MRVLSRLSQPVENFVERKIAVSSETRIFSEKQAVLLHICMWENSRTSYAQGKPSPATGYPFPQAEDSHRLIVQTRHLSPGLHVAGIFLRTIP